MAPVPVHPERPPRSIPACVGGGEGRGGEGSERKGKKSKSKKGGGCPGHRPSAFRLRIRSQRGSAGGVIPPLLIAESRFAREAAPAES